MINKFRTVPRSYIIVSTLSVLLLVIGLFYFVVWRPSDADYQVAIINTNSLGLNTERFTEVYSTTGLPNIANGDQLNSFVSEVDSYQQVVGYLLASPIAQRGFAARTEIDKAKATLVNYGKSIKATTDAVQIYYEIDRSCGLLRTDALATFKASELEDCHQAFTSAKNVSDSGFKTQFLSAYVSDVEKMLSISLDSKTDGKTKQGQIGVLQADLNKQLQNVHIKYDLPPQPTTTLNNLLTVFNSELSSLFR